MHRSLFITCYVVIALLFCLLIMRVIAPYAIKSYVNQTIESTPDLEGQIDDVSLSLLTGSYTIENIALYSVYKEHSQPLLKVESLDFSLLWSGLVEGVVVAKMQFVSPEIYLLDQPASEVVKSDAIQDEDTWIDLANQLVPISIDELAIENGRFIFDVKNSEDTARFFIDSVSGKVRNIVNRPFKTDDRFAQITFNGQVMGSAEIRASGQFQPLANKPTFDVDVKMEKLPIKHLDSLIKYYTPVDVEAGQVDMALEAVAEDGQVKGYVKAGVHNIDIFKWREDVEKDNDDPLTLFVDALIGGLSSLLENDKSDLLATRIPLEGQVGDVDTPVFPAIVALLKNAFVKALDMNVEDIISIESDSGTHEQDERA
ncbi:DUF748 domain-containing protein [Aestuariibacter sp. AA17]|uniref:DUF748 domain-containing protein n=1 Tax=Fluctibacter corallii TaxID=2984329 RepID=A0ABT3A768_9ALTE|nr:DUF748 domain-containing protein [Aestuariibacter sp. AA17]MCV2884530.1 DUF748 domain-containing protein [Aestuariibacter sp. AA17]